jgi:predicted nucleic acid-binding protein
VIQLDTSFLIRALVRGSPESAKLRVWFRERESVIMAAPAWTEFLCGPVSGSPVDIARQLVGDPLPFSSDEAEQAALLFNETGRRRGSLIDCMIAATAIVAGDSLATVNLADFRRFEPFGLAIA